VSQDKPVKGEFGKVAVLMGGKSTEREISPVPVPMAARAAGIEFDERVVRILEPAHVADISILRSAPCIPHGGCHVG
jgi:hypothetical protein